MTTGDTGRASAGGRKALQFTKWLFILASLAYLVHFFRSSIGFSDIRSFASIGLLVRLVVASLVFASTAILCVIAWRTILRGLSFDRSRLAVARVFCVTQVGKYLPGNVGHHIGRVAGSGTALGVPARIAVISVLQESALACLAALAVAVSGHVLCQRGSSFSLGLSVSHGVLTIWILAASVLASIAALYLIDRFRSAECCAGYRALHLITHVVPSPRVAFVAGVSFIGVFILNGVALWLVGDGIGAAVPGDVCVLSAAYALAWVVGFVIPGAPGGLGVREAVLVSLLGGLYPPDIAFGITMASRLCSIGADALILLCGLLLPANAKNEISQDSIHG